MTKGRTSLTNGSRDSVPSARKVSINGGSVKLLLLLKKQIGLERETHTNVRDKP